MTSDRSSDPSPDVLGVRTSLPAPGWTVLDTARDQRFTGELVATTDTGLEYRIYLDRGDVYVAERSTDPSLGVRLVDAGAINAAQLEYGTLRIGDIEHLGRLFDRVPSINRDAVFVLNQLMTEETVRALAGRSVSSVDATPYRHHPSGMHHWSTSIPPGTPAPWGEQPEMALPAPAPDARPVAGHEPAPAPPSGSPAAPNFGAPSSEADAAPHTRHERTAPGDVVADEAVGGDVPDEAVGGDDANAFDRLFLDDVVEWNEPSVLVATATSAPTERRDLFPSTPHLRTTDWVDQLRDDNMADAPVEPAVHARLRPVAVPPAEQFEVVWPSGETVDVTAPDPAEPAVAPEPVDESTRPHSAPLAAPQPTDGPVGDPAAPEAAPNTANDGSSDAAGIGNTEDRTTAPEAPASDPATADALAVRRAVATIDTGSLAVRRRLASPGDDLPTPPGRLIVGRDHHTAWRPGAERPTGSVFDAQPAAYDDPDAEPAVVADAHERRSGALKRLIGSLRRT